MFSHPGRVLGLRSRWAVLAVLATAWTASPAFAHKLSAFATAEGKTIRGRAYLHGGASVGRAAVSAFDPQGEKLAETTTDEQGKFSLEARFRCDHRLIVDSGDGHRAEYTLRAAALPDNLPGRGAEPDSSAERASGAALLSSQPLGGPASSHDPSSRAKLEDLARQIEQLQIQIDEFGNRSRLQDILGGLGYILGLMGLAYYFLGVRRKCRAVAPRDESRG